VGPKGEGVKWESGKTAEFHISFIPFAKYYYAGQMREDEMVGCVARVVRWIQHYREILKGREPVVHGG
jgi:hypothetical protein